MPAEKRAVLIAGPTASGKSALALKLAREREGVIINADSMQVYRELRILTARPTIEDEKAVPHRLYGTVSGAEPWSAAKWLTEARREIEAAWAQDALAIVVGGTGLYFRALEEGLADIPAIPPAVREHWRKSSGDLHLELSRRDPRAAARLNPGDRQRIVRALEVVEGTGRPLGFWHAQAKAGAVLAGVAVERLFVHPDRQELYARADLRFGRMVEEGAVEEVKALLKFALPASQPIMKAIGVREIAEYLDGKSSLEGAIREAQTATRQYIKRQLTWWRHQMTDWTVVGA